MYSTSDALTGRDPYFRRILAISVHASWQNAEYSTITALPVAYYRPGKINLTGDELWPLAARSICCTHHSRYQRCACIVLRAFYSR